MALPRAAETTMRWNAMGGCCRLRTLYKRIVVPGIMVLLFVLGANYLLVYTLNQQVVRERERQDRVCWGTFNPSELFRVCSGTGAASTERGGIGGDSHQTPIR